MTTLIKNKPFKKGNTWHYPELPSGMRKANYQDFSILSEELVFGINILLKAEDYEARNIQTRQELQNYSSEIAAGKVFIEKLPYKQFGLWMYPKIPVGCRAARQSDFITADNSLIENVDFLILSSLTNQYEAHRTTTMDRFIDYIDWIPYNRVFVKA